LPRDTLRVTLGGRVPSACERDPSLPRDVDRVLGRAMDPDPGKRHSSAWELLDELVGAPEGRRMNAGLQAMEPALGREPKIGERGAGGEADGRGTAGHGGRVGDGTEDRRAW